jgi:hypothetical protein
MDLRALYDEILSDESESGRTASLAKFHEEIKKTKGYSKKILGKTKHGPVYFCGHEESEEKKDVLILGGVHPFCEAATAVAVIQAMREKPDCNVYAIPVVSPWAFVAPVDYRAVDAGYRAEEYRCDKYHNNVGIAPLECRKGDNFEGDISRLKDLGRTFDLSVECHMGFDSEREKLGKPVGNVEMHLSDVSPGFVKPLCYLLKDAADCGIALATPLFERAPRLGHLLNECGANIIIETDPNDLTLVQRFLDAFVKRL